MGRLQLETNGAVIIPFYVRKISEIHLLEKALSTIPSFNGKIIIAAQGSDQVLLRYRKVLKKNKIISLEFNEKIGKWPAIVHCISNLNGDEQWITVFDGDGTFDGKDIPKLVKPIISGKALHTIGKRSKILLSSTDQLSENTRIYIEAFFNTLILILLGKAENKQFYNFDIQCGFHAFSYERCLKIAKCDLHVYGGELTIFYETISSGGSVKNIPIKQVKSVESTYTVTEIVNSLLNLYFLKGVATSTFFEAIEKTPQIYHLWISDNFAFRKEMMHILKIAGKSR